MRISAHRPVLSAIMLTVLVTVLVTVLSPVGTASATAVRLGGVEVRLRPGTTQVVTVDHRRGFHATAALWALRDGRWRQRLRSTDGRIGYAGLVAGARRRQGTGTTPLGTYGLISSFGMHRRGASWDLPYRRVRAGDYWVEDNASRFYNRYRNKAAGGFRWRLQTGPDTSERLLAYPRQYEYAIVTDFNRGQVRHRGAGIFLHVNGSGATAGCVSAPRWFVRQVIARLSPSAHPVIAIGR